MEVDGGALNKVVKKTVEITADSFSFTTYTN